MSLENVYLQSFNFSICFPLLFPYPFLAFNSIFVIPQFLQKTLLALPSPFSANFQDIVPFPPIMKEDRGANKETIVLNKEEWP